MRRTGADVGLVVSSIRKTAAQPFASASFAVSKSHALHPTAMLPAAFLIESAPAMLGVPITRQLAYLLLLALPIACVSWTVTHEEVFREPREFCKQKCETGKALVVRKFFYLFTCEYCFSHYVTALFLLLMQFQMLYQGWRGYLVSWFALVWVANVYMSFFNRLRLDIKHENVTIAVEQTKEELVKSRQLHSK